MKILILNWRDIRHEWAGGSEVYLFEIAKRWTKMGHTVTLFCGQDIFRKLPDDEIIDGIHVVRKGNRFTLYAWAFWYYVKRFRKECDVIVDVQNGIPFFSTLYSRKPKIAVTYHVHGKQFFVELPFPMNIIGYISEKFFFPLLYRSTKIMAISQTTKHDLLKLGFKKKNIEIVYCGITSKGTSVKRKRFNAPTVLYLGRIKKYKRVDMLVKIMPEIIKRVPNAHLLIAGWGTEGNSVMDISMRSTIKKRVKIVGPVTESEKNYLLSRAWVFVNPSIGEGWGISIIEANLVGTPAVAFNVAGLSESIKDNETGLLGKTEQDLIDNICLVLENKKLREKLSKNSQKWAKTFDWDKAARESFAILKKVSKN